MPDRVKEHRRRERVTIPPLAVPAHHHVEDACGCEPTIGYVRVSKVGERDEDLKSPQIQLDYIVGHAIKNNKRIVKLVSDINKSGYTNTKRNVDSVIDDIAKGVAKSVTVWKWSRWGRNVRKSLVYLERVKAAGGRVESATEDMDPDTAHGEFNRAIIMAVDQQFSRSMGEVWNRVHAMRRQEGLPHSGRERFGYQYFSAKDIRNGDTHSGSPTCQSCKDRQPHFVVDPIEGPELQGLYERFNQGESIRSLVQHLNAGGLVSPFGNRWTPQALIQMMDTGFAAGLLRERSPELIKQQEAQQVRVRNSLASFDVWRTGGHPAVISEHIWNVYKAKRLSRAGLPPRSRVGAHGLSALMVCNQCGCRMVTKYSGRDRTHQWVCSWAKSLHPTESVSISNTNALRVVRLWLAQNKEPHSDGEHLFDLVQDAAARAEAEVRSEQVIKAEISQQKTKLLRFGDLYVNEVLTMEQVKAKQAEVEEKILKLTLELDQVGRDSRDLPSPAYFEELERVLDDLVLPEDLSSNLRKVVGMVIVRPAHGRQARSHPEDRVEVVGAWEMSSWTEWFAERRVKDFAQL